jgi:hypothetical protein
MTAEIETVTVTVEELKENLAHYYRLKETKRLVVTREEEVISVSGPWLPGERRWRFLKWHEILYEMFPDPILPDDPELGDRAMEEVRGYRPFTPMPPRSPSSS